MHTPTHSSGVGGGGGGDGKVPNVEGDGPATAAHSFLVSLLLPTMGPVVGLAEILRCENEPLSRGHSIIPFSEAWPPSGLSFFFFFFF